MNIRKILFASAITLLAVLLLVGSLYFLHRKSEREFSDLERVQSELVQELTDHQGEYDEKSIVLMDTSKTAAKELAKKLGADLRITFDGSFATLTLPEGVTFMDVAQEGEYLSDLPKMSIDYQARIAEVVPEDENGERIPARPQYVVTDGSYELQQYLDYINMQDVWDTSTGEGVVVAVIDTGIDTDHPEFVGRISPYSYNASEDKIVKDYKTADGSYDWSLIEDEQGHGTSVAAVIGASMGSGEMVGIAPDVTLLVIKADCYADGIFKRSSDLVHGLYYAIEHDAHVVNMSFGGEFNFYADAAELAKDSDIILVAAAGNHGDSSEIYPAADENVIGVGALAANSWELAKFSAYGQNTNIVAPGQDIFTAAMGGGYRVVPGTSVASPIVTAALALMKSNTTYKYASNEKIIEILYASTYDIGDPGPDYYFGYGAIDVYSLVCGRQGTVTFDYLTDEIDETKQIFIADVPLKDIPFPERDYSIFEGWFYDIECTDPFNLYTDSFSADLTLYAKWGNESDGLPFTYRVLDDGTIEILRYTGRRNYITVPEIIDNRIVSSIGNGAFRENMQLIEVKLPETLTNIGGSAFELCIRLASIKIPANVISIGEKAFSDCGRLSYVEFSQDSKLEEIGNFAFAGCYRLENFELPRYLKTINGSAFYGTGSLKKFSVHKENASFSSVSGILFDKSRTTLVAYPAGLTGSYAIPDITNAIGGYAFAKTKVSAVDLNQVKVIGDNAFEYSHLGEIVIPDSVGWLGQYAFANATYLMSVEIGRGLYRIPEGAFTEATCLSTVSIPENIVHIDDLAFKGCTGLTIVDLAENGKLTYIGKSAFYNSGVAQIQFPQSLVKLEENAFRNCVNLRLVSFAQGSRLNIIEKGIFLGCNSLQAISFAECKNLYSIGAETFSGARSLQAIELPPQLNTIERYAFSGTSSLRQIVFPESLRIIGDCAFEGSGLLGVVNIAANIESIGYGAFASCRNITGYKVDANNNTYIDYDGVLYTKDGKILVLYPAGSHYNFGHYTIRNGTEIIGRAAFKGSQVSSVTMPEGLIEIAGEAFYGCYLRNVYFPQSLQHIGEQAFAYNSAITQISIPSKVITIGSRAFYGDTSLRSIVLSETAELSRIGFEAFAGTSISSFRVPANVSSIAQYAFAECPNLMTITFAQNSKLEAISAYMFQGSSNITMITFEQNSSLNSIQAHAFEGMTKLVALDLGSTQVSNIDNYAFRYCTALKSITLPETLTNIGRFAFYKCASLNELTIPAATEHIGSYAFYGTGACNLYFAADSLPKHLDEQWDNGLQGDYTGVLSVETSGVWKYAIKTNGNIAVIAYSGKDDIVDLTQLNFGGSIETIGGHAFEGSNIQNIILPNSVVEIQLYAFADTKNLTQIVFGNNVEYIAAYAFASSGIHAAIFEDSNVETIERYAFAFTNNLRTIEIPASLQKLGAFAFYKSGLEVLTFEYESSLAEISQSAFAGTGITSVDIPDSVVRIQSSAFRDNLSLKSVRLGNGADLRIDSNAFYNTAIESLYVPDNVRYIGEYAFVGLKNLQSYAVAADNKNYTAVDGVLYNKDQSKIIAFPAGRAEPLRSPCTLSILDMVRLKTAVFQA